MAFALVIAGAVWWQAHRYPLYSTDIGERRSITLADGSTVDLNARSQLRVEFSKTERRVELLDGQALFQVTKDMQRPFIVHSGDAMVRAVGTQFDVYRKTHGTTITVLEGRVAVYSSAQPEPPMDQPNAGSDQTNTGTNAAIQHALPRASTRAVHSGASMSEGSPASSAVSNPGLSDPSGSGAIFLSAGEQVTVTPAAAGTPVPQHADIAAATAWMQRKLIFEGSKLSDVVSEFNRYNRRQLVIEDPKLADFQISGVYSSTDPASLVLFMRDQGLNVTEGDNEIRIEKLDGTASRTLKSTCDAHRRSRTDEKETVVDAGLVRRHVSRGFASAVFGPRSRCLGTKPGLSSTQFLRPKLPRFKTPVRP